jgi:hypothetical protein
MLGLSKVRVRVMVRVRIILGLVDPGLGEGEAGKRAKMTPDAGGKSVSEKSQAAHTCRNPSRNQQVSRQNFSSVK